MSEGDQTCENAKVVGKTVKQTIVETIEAPRLVGIEKSDFITLKRREKLMND